MSSLTRALKIKLEGSGGALDQVSRDRNLVRWRRGEEIEVHHWRPGGSIPGKVPADAERFRNASAKARLEDAAGLQHHVRYDKTGAAQHGARSHRDIARRSDS